MIKAFLVYQDASPEVSQGVRDIELPVVPRVGERIQVLSDEYEVTKVIYVIAPSRRRANHVEFTNIALRLKRN